MPSDGRSGVDVADNNKKKGSSSAETRVSRREFVKTATAAGGALMLGSASSLFAHRAGHDGESLLRSFPRLAARSKRHASRPELYGHCGQQLSDLRAHRLPGVRAR
ncbi:MAG: hypothetical protein DMG81_00800 [Acidobacteria bacterium]|nr:MAG: hypothetical protein DMG81_00800 [Acidobacteriota bacterium]